jgi:methylase of polypeptide subunit release factors
MILKQKYNREGFLEFQKQFLPDFKKDIRRVTSDGLKVTENVVLLGQSEQLDLHVFEFTHNSTTDPRVSLTSDGFRIMKDHAITQALAVYQSENSEDWRLSLMTATLDLNQKGRVTQSFSNPRRYSFFLGPEARVHTPEEFLVKRGRVKDTQDLVSRFDVEIVTKEFFQKYKALFDNLQRFLSKDHAFKGFAEKNNIDIDTFAKKILGQIVFCYFLQKKGWLGAPKGESINKGDKDFMRSLFNRCVANKESFYNNYLEHLFYDSLNAAPEEKGDFYRNYLGCQIPFLNGGLFEPLENYDWKKSFLHIPDTIFSNKQGEGILDVFDLYNFTVYEDDPVDREVSVDPEMLGKVFENLLPENLRKGQGAYYTPREIVHYMCQESLINHLAAETGIENKNVRKLITSKDHLFANDGVFAFTASETEKIDKALAGIKVCDPACGSGAFLVGMLHEIVMARRVLNPKEHEYRLKKEAIQNAIYGVDIDPGAVEIAKLRLWLSLVVDYELEDIEPLPNLDYKIMCGNSLLEELIVGEEAIKLFDERLLYAGKKKAKTALFGEGGLEGAKETPREEHLQKLLQEKQKEMLDLNNQGKLTPIIKRKLDKEMAAILKELTPRKRAKATDCSPGLFTEKAEEYFAQLRQLQKQYFSESDSGIKKRLRKQIEQIELEFIKSSIQEKIDNIEAQIKSLNLSIPGNRQKNAELVKRKLEYAAIPDTVKSSKTKPYFLWKLNYFEIFQEKNGFDIVVANPPYIEFKKLTTKEKKKYLCYQAATGKFDVYVLFLELGGNLLKENGNLIFITPTSFMKKDFGVGIRNFISKFFSVRAIHDFADIQIFEGATNYTGIFIFTKRSPANDDSLYHKYFNIGRTISSEELRTTLTAFEETPLKEVITADKAKFSSAIWNFQNSKAEAILNKMSRQAKLLSEYADEIFEGIASGKDEVFYIHSSECSKLKIEEKILFPLLKGKDIKAYKLNWSGYYVIYPYDKDSKVISEKQIEQLFPNAYLYLCSKKEVLQGRTYFDKSGKLWYELWNQRKLSNFHKNRIVTPEISDRNNFALTNKYLGNTKTYHIILKDDSEKQTMFILGLLNSKLVDYFYKKNTTPHAGGFYAYKTQFLKNIPVVTCSDHICKKIGEYVRTLLKSTNDTECAKAVLKMDECIYSLYGLTNDEIRVVENHYAEKRS